MSVLRSSAKDFAACQYCYAPNPDGQQLSLAHSNAYPKTPDVFGAVLCKTCHDLVDGRTGALTLHQKREMHRIAHDRTLLKWIEMGLVKVAS